MVFKYILRSKMSGGASTLYLNISNPDQPILKLDGNYSKCTIHNNNSVDASKFNFYSYLEDEGQDNFYLQQYVPDEHDTLISVMYICNAIVPKREFMSKDRLKIKFIEDNPLETEGDNGNNTCWFNTVIYSFLAFNEVYALLDQYYGDEHAALVFKIRPFFHNLRLYPKTWNSESWKKIYNFFQEFSDINYGQDTFLGASGDQPRFGAFFDPTVVFGTLFTIFNQPKLNLGKEQQTWLNSSTVRNHKLFSKEEKKQIISIIKGVSGKDSPPNLISGQPKEFTTGHFVCYVPINGNSNDLELNHWRKFDGGNTSIDNKIFEKKYHPYYILYAL